MSPFLALFNKDGKTRSKEEKKRKWVEPALEKILPAVFDRWFGLQSVGRPDPQIQTALRKKIAQATNFRLLPPMVDLSQVKVGRDVDLRKSTGIESATFENAKIGGDLQFASKSSGRFRTTADAGNIDCPDRAKAVTGLIDMRAVDVAGDAFLVFDPRRGPVIKAGMAKIGGRLDIYPQVDVRSYQLTKPKPDGFWLHSCEHGTRRPANAQAGEPFGLYCDRCDVMIDKIDDHVSWYIDLRQAKAAVFCHPPAAWPDPGALSLDGFAYQQTSDLGPLAPKPRLVESEDVHFERARLRYAWRQKPWSQFAVSAAFASLIGMFVATVALGLWSLTRQPLDLPFTGGSMTVLPLIGILASPFLIGALSQRWLSNLARVLVAAVLILLVQSSVHAGYVYAPALAMIIAIMLALTFVWKLTLRLDPTERRWRMGQTRESDKASPRALEYLDRQRVSESRFKWRPSGYTVLDSYVRAAKALREAGRYISANMVEEERLRRRTKMMSWRHHLVAKLLLNLVDRFSGYGFRLSRAMALICVTISVTAIGAHWAAVNSYLVPAATADSAQQDATSERDREAYEQAKAAGSTAPDRTELRPGRCGGSPSASSLGQECPDIVYAIDLLVPVVDFGEQDRWTTQVPRFAEGSIERFPEPAQSLLVSFIRSWPAVISGLGLFLTAIMATAVAARVESAFTRVEE